MAPSEVAKPHIGSIPSDVEADAAALVVRVGYRVALPRGWWELIVGHAPWPLGVLTVRRGGFRVGISLFGFESNDWNVPWTDVRLVQPIWTGMRIDFQKSGDSLVMWLSAPRLWRRFCEACSRHGFEFVDPA